MGAESMHERLKKAATAIFRAGINAVDPEDCINRRLRRTADILWVDEVAYDLAGINKLYVLGAGKASAAMALAVERLLGLHIDDGVVVTKYGHGRTLQRCRLLEAGHPVPDENGLRAADALLKLVATAGPDDLLLCLFSGGGSALLPAPAMGISLADKQETTRLLLACGATIHEINTIRKHLSRLKGGRLCRAAGGGRIVSLIISDVIGDDLGSIASGMTAPDAGTFGDCLAILSRYGLEEGVPAAVRRHISEGAKGRVEETPKPGDPAFAHVRNLIVGSISDALAAAGREAGLQGFTPLILTSMLHWEAREVAMALCSIAAEVRQSGRPVPAPACLLSGGETTVTIRGGGQGGRNMEFALAAGIELAGLERVLLLSAGTDGTDGPTDAAGAFADGSTVSRAQALGISADRNLVDNDSYNFFRPLRDLFITGPTCTNVMDLQIVLIQQ